MGGAREPPSPLTHFPQPSPGSTTAGTGVGGGAQAARWQQCPCPGPGLAVWRGKPPALPCHTLLCFPRDWPNQEAYCWEAGQELTYLLLPAAASSTRLRSRPLPHCSAPQSHTASPSHPWGHPGVTGAREQTVDHSGTCRPPWLPGARAAGGGTAIPSARHHWDPQLRRNTSMLGSTLRPPRSPWSCRLQSPRRERR